MHQKFALPIRLRILPRFHCAFAGVDVSVMLKNSQSAHCAYFAVTQSSISCILIRSSMGLDMCRSYAIPSVLEIPLDVHFISS